MGVLNVPDSDEPVMPELHLIVIMLSLGLDEMSDKQILNGGSFLFRLQMEGVLSSPPPPSSVPGPASTRRLALHAHKLFSHTEPAARESGSTSSIKQSKGWGVMGNHQQPADDGWKIFWQEGSGSCWQVTSCQVLIPALIS